MTTRKFREIVNTFQRFNEQIPVSFVGGNCALMEVDEYTIEEFTVANASLIVTHSLMITSTEEPTVWATGCESADYRLTTSSPSRHSPTTPITSSPSAHLATITLPKYALGSTDAHYRTVVPTKDAVCALYDTWFDTQSRAEADWQQLTF